jgi:Tfp pilus assembly protein PilN
VFAIAMMVLFLWHMVLRHRFDIETKQEKFLQQQLVSLEKLAQEKNKEEQQQNEQSVTKKVAELEKKQKNLVRFFEGLHRGMSASLKLTRLLIKNEGISLFGKADTVFGVGYLAKSFSHEKNCESSVIQKIRKQDEDYEFVLSLRCNI